MTTTIIQPGQDIGPAWTNANPGDRLLLAPGRHKRWDLKPTGSPFQSQPVWIESLDPTQRALVTEDRSVGSTDTARLRQAVRDLIVRGIDFEIDDRAAVKTEYEGTRRVSFINCKFSGNGLGPYDPLWKNDSLWGFQQYQDGGFSLIDCAIEKVFKEHAEYQHNAQGNHAFHGNVIRWCGRTRLQMVARKNEGPVGKGDVLVRNEIVIETCFERGGGGWTYSFMGGMPESVVTIENVVHRQGCDEQLALPFQGNATGFVMMQSAGPSAPGKGDEAHAGGTKALIIKDCDSEIGSVYFPVSNARRSHVRVGECGEFQLHGGRILNAGNGIALEVLPACKVFRWYGDPDIGSGWFGKPAKIRIHGKEWLTWADYAASAEGQATHSTVMT